MEDQHKTKEQLINELAELRQQVAELETSEAERKRVEETLKESEAKFKSLFEGSHDPILLADPETGRFVACNRKAEELSGYSRDEILSMKIGQFTPEDLKEETPEELQNLVAGKGTQKEWEILNKDGNRIPVEISSTLISVGDKSYLQGVVRDITERKRAERTLKKSEERFRASVESLLDGFAIFSAVRNDAAQIIDFTYEYVNDAGCRLSQTTRDEMIGKTLLKVDPRQNEMGLFEEYVRVVETGQAFFKESLLYEDLYGGGKRLTRAFDYRAVKLEDGFVLVWRDITSRKRNEELLRQSEERFRALVENSQDVVMMQDLNGKYLYYNGPARYGLTPKDVVGETPFDLFDPVTAVKVTNQLKQVISSGHAITAEEKASWKGKSLWFLDHKYPIRDREGKLVAVGTIARDITERKRTEEEFKSTSEQLRALSAHLQSVREEERTLIAREIHDELGQALTALKMDLSWLNKKLPRDQKPLHEKAREMSQLLDTTVKAVKRISTELRPGLLDDLGIAAAIQWQAEEFQNRTGIKCSVTVTPEEIVLDEILSTVLFRIFQETLTNVARHSHATRAKVSLRQRVTKLELKVQDHGKGITERQISGPKSFGLIGMRERVYPWGGEVKIEGKPGKGTTVTVTIPLKKR